MSHVSVAAPKMLGIIEQLNETYGEFGFGARKENDEVVVVDMRPKKRGAKSKKHIAADTLLAKLLKKYKLTVRKEE